LETIFRAIFPGLSRFCADFWSVAYHTNTLTVPLFRRFQPFLATFLPYHVCVLYLADSKSGKKDLPPTFRLSWLLNHRLWHHFAFSFPYSRRTFTSFLCIFVFLYIVFFREPGVFGFCYFMGPVFFFLRLRCLLHGVTSFHFGVLL